VDFINKFCNYILFGFAFAVGVHKGEINLGSHSVPKDYFKLLTRGLLKDKI
jgi:hypothetical protein